ncbi:Uncharacterized protein ChrSV_3486 [Chromobacterium vaccinii]|nr:Uncharacterized protein ChrSW_3486 [Chromobacterium vaccinii]QND90943.1 Uncharacterized protein ChrSV_3486 [Chromobacterium vaccinii]
MKKIQAVLKDIAQKTLLLAGLIDEAMKAGVLTQDGANDLVRRVGVNGYLTHSLETMICWTALDRDDPDFVEELRVLEVSACDFVCWMDGAVGQLQGALQQTCVAGGS